MNQKPFLTNGNFFGHSETNIPYLSGKVKIRILL